MPLNKNIIAYTFDLCELCNVYLKWTTIGEKRNNSKNYVNDFFVFIACQVMRGWPCNKCCYRIKNMVECSQQLTQYRRLIIIVVSFYDKSYSVCIILDIILYICKTSHSVQFEWYAILLHCIDLDMYSGNFETFSNCLAYIPNCILILHDIAYW